MRKTHRKQSAIFTPILKQHLIHCLLAVGLATCHVKSAEKASFDSRPTNLNATDSSVVSEASAQDLSVAEGTHGAVASAEANASDIGIHILQSGGNAIDAAVAIGFALAVTHPSAGNLGGGGFMVVRLADGTTTAIDYREIAPRMASRNMYLDQKGEPTGESRHGPKAAGIPGTVAGLALAHQRFGRLSWEELVKPAIRLAREGHVLDSFHAEDLARASKNMEELGFLSSARYYQKADGSNYQTGDRWQQPELAATLELIAKGGAEAFYHGTFAQQLAAEVKEMGGIWTAEDLANYRAVLRKPIVFTYRNHEVITMPPPSGGGIVMRQMLAASEILALDRYPRHSAQEVHLYVEVARRTYADRNLLLADPDFVQVPFENLLDVDYVRGRLLNIDPNKATPSEQIGAGMSPQESMETTHFSVIDQYGNAVSNTYTLNSAFGAKVVVEGTGILLNNEMDDFSVKPGSPNAYGLVQGEQNRIEPGKRMLSSMTPTIITKNGKVRAIVGTPGGSTITTTVTQIVRALIDYQIPLKQAVKAPRIHHQWKPDRIMLEPGLDPELLAELRRRGHEIMELGSKGGWRSIGHANCIEVDLESGVYRAVADVWRDGGKAAAY